MASCTWGKRWILVLLAVQAYTCTALNNQQTAWITQHLKRPRGMEVHRSRHLRETTEKTVVNGWRASLIHTSYAKETENFTIYHKIHHDVEMSKERGKILDQRARNAAYTHHNKGRKMLDFVSDLQATPGSYSMEISIGTPPQKLIAIADTGSDLVWLQCAACDLCFESAKFDPSISSTYVPLGCPGCEVLGNNQLTCTPNCQYTYLYGDQSTTQGDFSLETVTLSNTNGTLKSIPEFKFGCGLRNNGTFSGTDGLVGLARGPISFTSQIAPSLDGSNKFSYCLLSRYDPDSERSPVFFGESAVPTNLTVSYTKILEPYKTSIVPYYYVSLLNITVAGETLSIPPSAFEIDQTTGNGGVIFDSGTTYTMLNSEAYQEVTTVFEYQLDPLYTRVDVGNETGLEVCYNISGLDSVTLPIVVFNFNGADFELPVDNTMIMFTILGQGDAYMCLALLKSTGLNIFGNFQQQNFQVLHDEDNLRIGWVALDCKTL